MPRFFCTNRQDDVFFMERCDELGFTVKAFSSDVLFFMVARCGNGELFNGDVEAVR